MLSFLKRKLQEGLSKLTKNVEEELGMPEEAQVPAEETAAAQPAEERTKDSASKTKGGTQKKSSITDIFTKKTLGESAFEDLFWEIEIGLLESNVAVEVIEKIKGDLKEVLVNQKVPRFSVEKTIRETLGRSLREILSVKHEDLLTEIRSKPKKPYILILIGINGSGKTTTLAKLVHLFKKQGLTSVIAACDTFRAAAIHQLEEHAVRLGTKIIKYDYGADSAAVAFDAIKHAEAQGLDVVLIDTAGRNHANQNLMNELEKLVRVTSPDKKIFIGDALTGNDAVEQAREFHEKVGIDGIILSKADCDEKGGCAVSMSYVTKRPIYYIGCGQTYDDLILFDAKLILDKLSLEDAAEEEKGAGAENKTPEKTKGMQLGGVAAGAEEKSVAGAEEEAAVVEEMTGPTREEKKNDAAPIEEGPVAVVEEGKKEESAPVVAQTVAATKKKEKEESMSRTEVQKEKPVSAQEIEDSVPAKDMREKIAPEVKKKRGKDTREKKAASATEKHLQKNVEEVRKVPVKEPAPEKEVREETKYMQGDAQEMPLFEEEGPETKDRLATQKGHERARDGPTITIDETAQESIPEDSKEQQQKPKEEQETKEMPSREQRPSMNEAPAAEEKKEKRKGFFSRLFGRK